MRQASSFCLRISLSVIFAWLGSWMCGVTPAEGGRNFVMCGTNVSTFYNRSAVPLVGASSGYGREWRWARNGFSLQLQFFYRGAKLVDIVVHPWPGEYVTVFDVPCRILYVAAPVLYRRYLGGYGKPTMFVSAGLAPNLAVVDLSTKREKKSWYDPDFPEDKADLYYNVDPDPFDIARSSTIAFVIGFGLTRGNLAVEMRLEGDLVGEVETVARLAGLETKFISFSLLGKVYL